MTILYIKHYGFIFQFGTHVEDFIRIFGASVGGHESLNIWPFACLNQYCLSLDVIQGKLILTCTSNSSLQALGNRANARGTEMRRLKAIIAELENAEKVEMAYLDQQNLGGASGVQHVDEVNIQSL